jgi:dolichol kinase
MQGFAGKLKNPFSKKKFFDGIIFGTIGGAVGALFFVNPIEACIGALIAIIAESVEFALNGEAVDDNLIVPLIAGTIIYLLRLWFGV